VAAPAEANLPNFHGADFALASGQLTRGVVAALSHFWVTQSSAETLRRLHCRGSRHGTGIDHLWARLLNCQATIALLGKL
jgi:hypothetical protein